MAAAPPANRTSSSLRADKKLKDGSPTMPTLFLRTSVVTNLSVLSDGDPNERPPVALAVVQAVPPVPAVERSISTTRWLDAEGSESHLTPSHPVAPVVSHATVVPIQEVGAVPAGLAPPREVRSATKAELSKEFTAAETGAPIMAMEPAAARTRTCSTTQHVRPNRACQCRSRSLSAGRREVAALQTQS